MDRLSLKAVCGLASARRTGSPHRVKYRDLVTRPALYPLISYPCFDWQAENPATPGLFFLPSSRRVAQPLLPKRTWVAYPLRLVQRVGPLSPFSPLLFFASLHPCFVTSPPNQIPENHPQAYTFGARERLETGDRRDVFSPGAHPRLLEGGSWAFFLSPLE